MNVSTDKRRVQVTLTLEEYERIEKYSKAERRSLSASIAKLAVERLDQLEGQ